MYGKTVLSRNGYRRLRRFRADGYRVTDKPRGYLRPSEVIKRLKSRTKSRLSMELRD